MGKSVELKHGQTPRDERRACQSFQVVKASPRHPRVDLRALTTEADAQATIHKRRQASLQTNAAKVTEWKALNYHSRGLLSSGTKVKIFNILRN